MQLILHIYLQFYMTSLIIKQKFGIFDNLFEDIS